MDNKYYTPSIEEFHIGFTFEVDDLSDDMLSRVWRKGEILLSDYMYIADMLKWIKDGELRVKYLDKDDIESLGFYEAKLKDSNNVVYLKDVNQGFNTGYTVALSINHNSFVTISYKSFSSYMNKEYSIDVIIKNKSELTRLLKQLNIQ